MFGIDWRFLKREGEREKEGDEGKKVDFDH